MADIVVGELEAREEAAAAASAAGNLSTPQGSVYDDGRDYYIPDYNNDDDDKADELLAKVAQADYERYLKVYRPKELDLIRKARTDTTLIDDAKRRASTGLGRMTEMINRQEGRYGGNLTAAQRQQRNRQGQLGSVAAGIQTVSDSRIAQADSNRALLGNLINIGQGVNKSALDMMSAGARGQVARENAEAAYEAQMQNMMFTALLAL